MDTNRLILSCALIVSIGLASCAADPLGSTPTTGGKASTPPTAPTVPASTAAPPQATAEGTASTTTTTIPRSTGSRASTSTVPDAGSGGLVDAVQDLAEAALQLDAGWNASGPTGVLIGVRAPGLEDVLVASGTSGDDQPLDPSAPFSVSTLGWSVVQEIAADLIAGAALDPSASLDTWLPDQPNADRITVQMLIDGTHGWGSMNDSPVDLYPANVVADLERSWGLEEVLETYEAIPPFAEPGTFDPHARPTGFDALAYVAEQASGHTLAELVALHSAAPLGLTDTMLGDGVQFPDGFHHGRFMMDRPMDTTEFPTAALFTYQPTRLGVISSVPDLLDMLDAWADGSWTDGGVAPDAAMFPDSRREAPAGPIIGLGVPYSGYCPCEPTDGGNQVTAIGRRPYAVGSDLHVLRYLDDDISVVVHFNSDAWTDRQPLIELVDAVHAAAAAHVQIDAGVGTDGP